MSVYVTDKHLAKAEKLVAKAKANNGLAPIDPVAFWEKNKTMQQDPWNCERMPLGLGVSEECMINEVGMEMDWYRMVHDPAWKIPYAKRYNDLAEEIVGKRFFNETLPDNDRPHLPAIKQLFEIFEAKNEWNVESYWLHQSATNPAELEALLDRVEARLENLRDFLLPENWEEGKRTALEAGARVPQYRSQRGPVTFAMSIYGVEELIYLIMDNEDLAKRFSRVILRAMLVRARILEEEAGLTPETSQHGFYWFDDNCAMLNADMYELFAYPIMEGVFNQFSPNEGDGRGQHSDSAMGHLLPLFGKLGMTSVNFGPSLSVTEIREHVPKAVIHGQLAPFTYSRNLEVDMVAELVRDVEMAREKKGVVFTTAGSINYGSRLSGLRLIMAAVEEYGQFDAE